MQTIAGGIIIYAIGYTYVFPHQYQVDSDALLRSSGLQLLTQIIIADITTLKWRGLVSGLTTAPFIVNAFIGANISSEILKRSGWRWGCESRQVLISDITI